MSFDIPLLLIISFLVCTALIVCYSIRKITSFRVYAVGTRQFSTASLVATSLANYYGGGTLIANITGFYIGLSWIIWRLLAISIPFLVLSYLSIRMRKFIYHISMPETMGRVYGNTPRVITALFSVFNSIVLIASQVYVVSEVINKCISSINPVFITILAAIILVAYTIFGGSRAVVLTDIWQFITFVSLICVIAWFIFTETNRPISETLAFITTQKGFIWSDLFVGKEKLAFTLRYLSFLFAFIEPGYMQHIYMASHPSQAKKVCLYAAIFGFITMICCIVVGAFTFAWVPSSIPQKETLNYLLTHISPLFKGLFCTCLLALAMSTADSRLHISTVMIIYDILPVLLRVRLRKSISYPDHYRVAYISIVVIATLSIFLSLASPTIYILHGIATWMARFYIPIVAAPFILGILGFRSNAPTALIGMVTGALAVPAWSKWVRPLLLTDSSIFPCVLANGLTMIAVHYLWPKRKGVKKIDGNVVKSTQ